MTYYMVHTTHYISYYRLYIMDGVRTSGSPWCPDWCVAADTVGTIVRTPPRCISSDKCWPAACTGGEGYLPNLVNARPFGQAGGVRPDPQPAQGGMVFTKFGKYPPLWAGWGRPACLLMERAVSELMGRGGPSTKKILCSGRWCFMFYQCKLCLCDYEVLHCFPVDPCASFKHAKDGCNYFFSLPSIVAGLKMKRKSLTSMQIVHKHIDAWRRNSNRFDAYGFLKSRTWETETIGTDKSDLSRVLDWPAASTAGLLTLLMKWQAPTTGQGGLANGTEKTAAKELLTMLVMINL